MTLSQRGLIIVALLGLAFGMECLPRSIQVLKVRNAPIVVGKVISQTPCKRHGVPSVDIAIRLEEVSDVVHAQPGRSLMDKIPSTVRFRYNGNPSEEVFLLQYQQNPIWLCIIGFGTAFMALAIFCSKWRASKSSVP